MGTPPPASYPVDTRPLSTLSDEVLQPREDTSRSAGVADIFKTRSARPFALAMSESLDATTELTRVADTLMVRDQDGKLHKIELPKDL